MPLPADWFLTIEKPCSTCQGERQHEGRPCSTCAGTGRLLSKMSLPSFKKLLDGHEESK